MTALIDSMSTVTIKGCRPAQPPVIFLRRRLTLEPTGGAAQDRGPARVDCMAAALDLDKIPQALKDWPQWVCYRSNKIPVNPKTGDNAKADEPDTWGYFDQAVRHWEAHRGNSIAGIGYEFSPDDPFTGIDLDKCLDPKTGEIEPWGKAIIDRLQSYTEISPSGCGVHILVRGKLPPGGNRKGKVEMYNSARYFTTTGRHLEGTPTTIEDRQDELTAIHREVFGDLQEQAQESPRSTAPLDLTDLEIIAKTKSSQNGDKFDRLMVGDITGYPSASEADMALCSVLTFWTQDPGQIDRIFRASGLYREKWDRATAGSTYGAKTIDKALAGTTQTYRGGASRINGNRITPAGSAAVNKTTDEAPSPSPAMGYNLTDMGNAQRLVARHGQNLRYCYPWGKWLIWDGTRWIKDESGEVDRRTKETVRSIYAEVATIEEKTLREVLVDHAKRSESDSKRQAMINSARSEPGVAILPADLDRDPWLLNVLNGTIDLRTGELRAHHHEDLVTKLAHVIYDTKAECPTWWKFLERIFNRNYELILFLQKAVGYALTGITWEQVLFFLYGLGANGKSTFIKVIQALLGDYATQTTSETFMVKRHSNPISNDVADLRGARFVAAVEIESGRHMAEVLVKQMTGGDKLKARFLYSEHFEFDPEFKIFLAANHKPVIRGTDNAIWRRIHLIPFTVQIPEKERDRELPEKLKAELSGILNWGIEGCMNWKDHGLTPPSAVRDATQNYQQEMDTLADFLAECCIIAPGASVPASDLYKAYTTWGTDAGEKALLSQRTFGVTLSERGFEGKRGTGGKTVRHGIGLRA